jgi:alpha-D-ribose 1-methylphosphonate 5-triphosphate synthase subunit PhnG
MPCDDCAIAREASGNWRRFNNRACIWCAARLIQRTTPSVLGIAAAACTERRKAALAVAMDAGFEEAEVRKLIKGPLALEPLPEKEKKK